MLPDEDRLALSKLRFEHAEECAHAAEALYRADDLRGAANRSYYAVFHAMRAVLALDGIDRKHHSAIIAEFRLRYIKSNVFDRSWSDVIQLQSEYRTSSDYNDFFIISREEVETQIQDAVGFLDAVRDYLNTVW